MEFDISGKEKWELEQIKAQQPEVYKKLLEAILEIEGYKLEHKPITFKDPQIDRVEAYKNNLVKELSTWRYSVDPRFLNVMLYNSCQALLKMIITTSSDIELNCLKSDYEPAKVSFTGSPISGKQGFDDVACDKVKVQLGQTYTMLTRVGDKERSFTMTLPVGAEISDGYHTFNELYDHRNILWLVVCSLIYLNSYHLNKRKDPENQALIGKNLWRYKCDSEWFLLGCYKEEGKQITYHLPMKYWDLCYAFTHTLDTQPEFDGHTSKDVLERLKNLI